MSHDEAGQGQAVKPVGQIEQEMNWLEKEIAACIAVKDQLHDRIVVALQPTDAKPGVAEEPFDIHSKMATRLRELREMLEGLRVCLEDMRDRSEL